MHSYIERKDKKGTKFYMSKTARLFLTEVQESYLAWLVTPEDSRNPKTKTAWADMHDVHLNTLGAWEKNKVFKERWELAVKRNGPIS